MENRYKEKNGHDYCNACHEEKSWCDCHIGCRKGRHQWSKMCEVCIICLITKKEISEGVTII